MKKTLFAGILIAGFFFVPNNSIVHGVTIEEIQAQIQALMQQLTALQAQQNTVSVSTKFNIGDTVRPTESTWRRSTPGGDTLTTMSPDSKGIVMDGPKNANVVGTNYNYNWWFIDYGAAEKGWSAENYLIKIGSATPVPTTQAPSVSFTLGSSANTAYGSSVPLNWNTSGASSCLLNGNSVPTNASMYSFGPLYQTITLTLTCTGSGGQTATKSVVANVNPQSTTALTVDLSASPTSITSGQSATIRLDATNAKYCIRPVGSPGDVILWPAVYVVSPTQTTTYTTTCYNNTGISINRSVTVTVNPTTTTFCGLTPTQTLSIGSRGTEVTNLQRFLTSLGLLLPGDAAGYYGLYTEGAVSNFQVSYGVVPAGIASPGQGTTGPLTRAKMNEVACMNAPQGTTLTPTPAPTVTLTASPTSITSGQSSTLSWSSNMGMCSWTNVNADFRPSGTHVVSPTQTTTYIVTCSNNSGQTASANATVTVNQSQTSAPTVTLTANYASKILNVSSGNPVTLRWLYTNANGCNNDWGYTGAKDSDTVYPTSNRKYTVTCYEFPYNTGRYTTASVAVTVDSIATPTIGIAGSKAVFNSEESITLELGKYPSTAASWTLYYVCDSGVVIDQKGGGGSCGDYSAVRFEAPYSTYGYQQWPINITNKTGSDKSVTVYLNARRVDGSVIGTSYVNLTVRSTTITPAPTVTLTASPSIIIAGQSTTLTYNANGFTSGYTVGCPLTGGTSNTTPVPSTYAVSPTQTTTYTVTCYNSAGQSASASATVTVNPTTPTGTAPYVSFTLGSSSNTSYGANVPVNWSTSGATSCLINGSTVPTNASMYYFGPLYQTTTLTLTCTASNGLSAAKSVVANVNPQTNNSPTVDLKINGGDSTVNVAYGGSVQVSWTASNVTYCSNPVTMVSNAGPTVSQSMNSGSLYASRTFAVSCQGINGQAVSDSVYVNVTAGTQTCTAPLAETRTTTSCPTGQTGTITETRTKSAYPSCTFGSWTTTSNTCGTTTTSAPTVTLTTSPTSITSGQSSTLSWSATGNPTSCRMGGTLLSGYTWAVESSGTQAMAPTQTVTYTVTCTNSAGSGSDNATITVGQAPPPPPPGTAPSVSFTLGSSANTSYGSNVPLNWSTSGASSCLLNGNSVPTNASMYYFGPLYQTTTLSLTCLGSGGLSTTKSVVANVNPQSTAAPTVDLKINGGDSTANVAYSGSVQVSWTATNVTWCSNPVTNVSNSGPTVSQSMSSGPLYSGRAFAVSCQGINGQAVSDSVFVNVSTTQTPVVPIPTTPEDDGTQLPVAINTSTRTTLASIYEALRLIQQQLNGLVGN